MAASLGVEARFRAVALPSTDHKLVLRADDVNRERQHDLELKGV